MMFEERGMRMLVAGAIFFVALGFAGGFVLGGNARVQNALPAAVAQAIGSEQAPGGVDFSPGWEAGAVIDEKFVPASVPPADASSTDPVIEGTPEQKRVYGMIQGLASSLGDPYTFYLPPVEQKQFEEDLSGEFTGVGMEIAIKDEILKVVTP